MSILAVGVEHSTAPLWVRERIAPHGEALARLIAGLLADDNITEIVVLSTCNRTECYLVAVDPSLASGVAQQVLIDGDNSLLSYLRVWDEFEAVEHLFRVACGLESQIPGEGQILSQVSDALAQAQTEGSVGPTLHALFRSAVSSARQARAGTALGRVNVSLGSEAVRSAEAALGSLQGRSVLLVGAGEIGHLIAERLPGAHPGRVFIANRTPQAAADLAVSLNGTPLLLEDLPRVLPRVDVVFSATSARGYVIRPEQVANRPGDRPLHIFDLALPRDVDPAVGELAAVFVHDLESLIPGGLTEHWTDDVRRIESVIAAEIQEFRSWYLTRRVVPVIAGLRSHVEAVSQQELKRVAPQLRDLTPRERAAVESLTGRLIDKMFHHLVLRLRLAAQTDPALVDAAEFFFLHGEGGLFEHAAQQGAIRSEEEQHTG